MSLGVSLGAAPPNKALHSDAPRSLRSLGAGERGLMKVKVVRVPDDADAIVTLEAT